MSQKLALLKAAAIPVGWWATALIAMAGWEVNPQWHSAAFMVDDPVWNALWFLAYGGLGAGTIVGWLLLRHFVQTRMALVLLVPYLVLTSVAVIATVMVGMALRGDS